jgi:regulator of ribonuclease activity A
MSFATCDLLDDNEAREGKEGLVIQVVAPMFKSYGAHPKFSGRIATLKVFEDNSLVREALASPGEGRVLVVDGGGSLRCALVGDQLGALGVRNGWAGIVVWGCIRDSVVINGQAIGIRALATNPRKSIKKGAGDKDVDVSFGGVTFRPGDWLYADEDGVIVSTQALTTA